jgi:asparagine synthase (glutamine-hydrolysing)
MCGIAGYVNTRSAAATGGLAVLSRMTDVIQHRGPDDSGFFQDSGVFLGHRRLSIIDLSAGHQPMANEDGTVNIVYNGEIFNHSDVRVDLERAGHVYTTHCDTETIIHAYEEYGPDCLARFRGMFAFALWDSSKRRLFCARDRLGIKPFYYYWDGRLFAFASEIKALLQHPSISPRLEEELLPEYLSFGYISEERTLFSGIRRLMPGHHLILDLAGREPSFDIRQYWDVPEANTGESMSEQEWIAECRRRLEETVRMRLMSDVPLGMFLSGGVDSSAIAALMKRMVSTPVKSFSVGYAEAEYSELSYARQVSETIGTEHHEVVVGMDDFFNAVPRLIWHEDEPITWPSSVSLYFVSKLASEQVKVVLTGEGSDELFAGYGRYRFYQWNSEWLTRYKFVPEPLRNYIRQSIATTNLLSGGLRRKLQHTFVGLGESIESLYLDNFYSSLSQAEQQRMGLVGGASPYANYLRYWNRRSGASPLARMLYADQKTYLVELLMKQDQMSMATSIESRVPLLDHKFVEFASQVPEHLKLRGSEGKYILKKAVEDLLPHNILYRKKMGFPTPIRQWLMDSRAKPLFDTLRQKDGVIQSFLDKQAVETLLDRHQRGLEDGTDRIWRLLNLQIWGDTFLTGKMETTATPLVSGSGHHSRKTK